MNVLKIVRLRRSNAIAETTTQSQTGECHRQCFFHGVGEATASVEPVSCGTLRGSAGSGVELLTGSELELLDGSEVELLAGSGLELLGGSDGIEDELFVSKDDDGEEDEDEDGAGGSDVSKSGGRTGGESGLGGPCDDGLSAAGASLVGGFGWSAVFVWPAVLA